MPNGKPIFDALRDSILAQIGATAESIHKIKLGRGAVGKITVVAVVAITAIALVGYRLTTNTAQLIAVLAVGVICLSTLGSILYVIKRQPELAVLEGAELVLYKQIVLGTKTQTAPPTEMPPIRDVTALPPERQDEGRES